MKITAIEYWLLEAPVNNAFSPNVPLGFLGAYENCQRDSDSGLLRNPHNSKAEQVVSALKNLREEKLITIQVSDDCLLDSILNSDISKSYTLTNAGCKYWTEVTQANWDLYCEYPTVDHERSSVFVTGGHPRICRNWISLIANDPFTEFIVLDFERIRVSRNECWSPFEFSDLSVGYTVHADIVCSIRNLAAQITNDELQRVEELQSRLRFQIPSWYQSWEQIKGDIVL